MSTENEPQPAETESENEPQPAETESDASQPAGPWMPYHNRAMRRKNGFTRSKGIGKHQRMKQQGWRTP